MSNTRLSSGKIILKPIQAFSEYGQYVLSVGDEKYKSVSLFMGHPAETISDHVANVLIDGKMNTILSSDCYYAYFVEDGTGLEYNLQRSDAKQAGDFIDKNVSVSIETAFVAGNYSNRCSKCGITVSDVDKRWPYCEEHSEYAKIISEITKSPEDYDCTMCGEQAKYTTILDDVNLCMDHECWISATKDHFIQNEI